MKLIVGLWNPGNEYEKTRHNIWFIMVDAFVQREKLGGWKGAKVQGCKGEMIEANIDDQKIIFLKPQEFMNRSGWAVSALTAFYKIDPKDVLVVHDDIDLPVGKIQLKLGGSSAGHNGLKDIILRLWTKDFWRLRIGVDRPVNQNDVADYVLWNFKKEEKILIEDKMSEIEKYIFEFLNK